MHRAPQMSTSTSNRQATCFLGRSQLLSQDIHGPFVCPRISIQIWKELLCATTPPSYSSFLHCWLLEYCSDYKLCKSAQSHFLRMSVIHKFFKAWPSHDRKYIEGRARTLLERKTGIEEKKIDKCLERATPLVAWGASLSQTHLSNFNPRISHRTWLTESSWLCRIQGLGKLDALEAFGTSMERGQGSIRRVSGGSNFFIAFFNFLISSLHHQSG